MAIRSAVLIGSKNLVHGRTTYAVTKDGILVGAPAAVEDELLALYCGFERCPEPERSGIAERLNQIVADASVLTPDEVRVRMDEAVRVSNPKTYEQAQRVARQAILDLTGEASPAWLTPREREALGIDPMPGREPDDLAERINLEEVASEAAGPAEDPGIPVQEAAPRPRLAAEPVRQQKGGLRASGSPLTRK